MLTLKHFFLYVVIKMLMRLIILQLIHPFMDKRTYLKTKQHIICCMQEKVEEDMRRNVL